MGTTKLKVKVSGVSGGKETARIGVQIPRSEMDIADANEMFKNSQCKVVLAVVPPTPKDSQDELPITGLKLPTLESVAIVKGYHVKETTFKIGLTLCRSEVEVDLLEFSGQDAELQIERTGNAPSRAKRKKANPAPNGAKDDEGGTD